MRHLNIDWMKLAERLAIWPALSEDARFALLQFKSNDLIPAKVFDERELRLLKSSGMLTLTTDRQRLRIAPEGRDFFKAMRAMHRHPLTADSDERTLEAYACEHLTVEEQQQLFSLPGGGGYYTYGRPTCEAAVQQAWLGQLLDLTSVKQAMQWEQQHLPPHSDNQSFEDGAPYFENAALLDATRRLIREAMTWQKPVLLTELSRRLPKIDPPLLWGAVMAAVRYLMLFAWLDGGSGMPVISLWPRIVYVLHRPAPVLPPPETDEPREIFHAPFLAEDMMTVLVAAAAEPLRLLVNRQGLYQKDIDRIAAASLALPTWLYQSSDVPGNDASPSRSSFAEYRVVTAVNVCLEGNLLKLRENRNGRAHYEIAPAGRDWLTTDMSRRISALVQPWRPRPQSVGQARPRRSASFDPRILGGGFFFPGAENEQRGLSPWVPPHFHWSGDPKIKKIDWLGAWKDVLVCDEPQRFRPMEPLLEYHCRVNNPLLGRRLNGTYGPKPRLDRYTFGSMQTDIHLENAWFDMQADLLQRRLIPLGAVEIGWDGQRRVIRLHPIGRYMLGLTENFEYEAAPEGTVIIQPNFEVVFMGPSPSAEAMLGRLAERTGHRMGAMFRITRDSIVAAAAAGVSSDAGLSDLAKVSSKPLPDNVRREVAGWFNSTMNVRLRHTWLIDMPDANTAARVQSLVGNQGRPIAPTIIEVTGERSSHSALIRKLKKAGIFVR